MTSARRAELREAACARIMAAPERVWIDGAFTDNRWQDAEEKCLSPHGPLIRADVVQALIAEAVEAAHSQRVDELAMMIRMLVRHVPDSKKIKARSVDYLKRHGLEGSPLRSSTD